MKKILALALATILLLGATPITATATTWDELLHQPGLQSGDLLKAGGEGSGLYIYDWDGVQYGFVELKSFTDKGIKTVQYDFMIWGDAVEFAGVPVITYDNGTVIYGKIDKYADGEHSTVILDTTVIGANKVEIFQAHKAVNGSSAKDNITFSFVEFNYDGTASDHLSGATYYYDSVVSNRSPYSPSSAVTKEGSVLDLITLEKRISMDLVFYDATAKTWPIPAATGNSSSTTPNFTDVPKDRWSYKNILEAYNRKLMTGVEVKPNGDIRFDPEGTVTRAQVAQILYNAYKNDLTAATKPNLTDVASSAWYHPAVTWMVANGLADVANAQFQPNASATREFIAESLYRMTAKKGVTLPKTAEVQNFSDIATAKYKDAITALQQAGVISGFTDGTFGPTRTLTREQAAALMVRYTDIKGLEPGGGK